MSIRQIWIPTLALIATAIAANSCCFVVQDEAHEVYWSAWTTETYTATVKVTSITTLVTPYPTTTVTNYETHVYPVKKVLTTNKLVTDNPVSLYTNPAYAIPQMTEVLNNSIPVETGGVLIASPTGFWVYHTAKIFVAPAVTDSAGNVVCGTVSSFTNVASTAPACIPTFSGVNEHAAAYYDSNGGQGVAITLTTPFVHVPTRADLLLSPTEACVQGNGKENYGYPVQQFINHLASNEFYSAQYPGIESCIPAGPSIKAVNRLAVSVTDNAIAATTDTGGGDIGGTTTTVTTTSSSETTTTTSSSETSITSTTTSPTSTTSTSSSSSSLPPALPDSTTSDTSTPGGPQTDTALPGGLGTDTTTSLSSSTSAPEPQSAVTTPASETTSESSTESLTLSETPTLSESSSSNSTVLLTSSSAEETAGPSSTSLESTSESTSEIPIPTSSIEVSTTTSEGNPTPTGSGTAGPSFVQALAVKEYINWELLAVSMGLILLGVW